MENYSVVLLMSVFVLLAALYVHKVEQNRVQIKDELLQQGKEEFESTKKEFKQVKVELDTTKEQINILRKKMIEKDNARKEEINQIKADLKELNKIKTGTTKDVAHGKSTYQSSTWSPHYPSSMAVDGNPKTVQHADIQHNPYWVVDLGHMYSITSVEVYNKPQNKGERFRDVDILVGEHHDNHMSLCAHYVGPSHTGAHQVFDCSRVLQGRFVKITIRQREYLHMAEVNVTALV